ncbi:hypothetical protein G6F57_012554 [Rhizopus arrhizus]|nr:hypothetical protein G6F57_012554 [Rhizopus arrhizus]
MGLSWVLRELGEEGVLGCDRVFGGEHAADHGDQVGAGVDDGTDIVRGQPADRHPRHAQCGALPQQVGVGAAAGELGGGGEEGAKGHIAGAGGHGLFCIGQLVVAGRADDGLGPQQRTRAGDVAVGAAQMHAGRADRLGQQRVVIDDQRYAMGSAQALQGSGLLLPQGVTGGLVAVLQPGGAGGQQRRGA